MTAASFNLFPDRRGTVFAVRVSPGASREQVSGEHAGALKVHITAPPEKGKANKALLKFLSKKLGVEQKRLTIVSGATSKVKRVLLHGMGELETIKILEKAADGE